MVKRWLSTFAEQPSPAALTVAAEDLDERMRCSHVLGVINEAEPVETATAASVREWMVTACNVLMQRASVRLVAHLGHTGLFTFHKRVVL